jgi:uncharacterized membrane protein YfcA|tara:strand:+ start:231 stop:527 length:297 start_codon:yes stop_codon:yes gene_type:complete
MNSIVTDVKTGLLVATGTISTGLGSFLDFLPNDIGKLATLIGMFLSLVVIYAHLKKGPMVRESIRRQNENLELEKERKTLEIELLKSQINKGENDGSD